jgi:DNA-binding NarL/FixJ family response regulator
MNERTRGVSRPRDPLAEDPPRLTVNGSPRRKLISRLLIADARELVVAAVRKTLETRLGGLELIEDVRSGEEMLPTARRMRPDVILLSSELPRNGFGLSALIRRLPPTSRTLILAPAQDEDLLVEILRAGAGGLVTEGCSLEDLVDAVREVQSGGRVVPHAMLAPLMNVLLRTDAKGQDDRDRLTRLTERERQVLTLLVSGSNAYAIARELVISRQTARTHVQRILAKLEVHSQTQAAAVAVRAGVRPERAMVRG